jgi:hypothetical protein
VYGIPPEQVVGSAGATEFGYDKNGKAILTKVPKLLLMDDAAGKPEGIHFMIEVPSLPEAVFGSSVGASLGAAFTAGGGGACWARGPHSVRTRGAWPSGSCSGSAPGRPI